MANSWWDDIKELFKTKKQKAAEENEKVNNALRRESQITGQLKALEDEYNKNNPAAPDPDFDEIFKPVKYDRVNYDVLSDDEIKAVANDKAESDYKSSLEKIDKQAYDDLVKLNEQREKAKETHKKTLSEIESLFDAFRENSKNKAVKQGIARGSILESAINEYGEAANAGRMRADDILSDALLSFEEKSDALKSRRDEALSNLDLKKAVEITETINKLQENRDKQLADQNQKNAALEKKEIDENLKLEKEKQKYVENYKANKRLEKQQQDAYEKANGYTGEKARNFAERYNVALGFYTSLDPDVAVKALEASGTMKGYLGNNYEKLLSVLKSRATTKTKKYI